jgi:hypothetical protein
VPQAEPRAVYDVEQHFLRQCVAHGGECDEREESRRRLRQTERGVVCSDGEIAGDHETEAACMRVAVDGRDQRLAEPRHGIVHVEEGVGVGPSPFVRGAGAAVVAAETEGVAGAGQHARADGGIRARRAQRRAHFARERSREAVAVLRPVQGEHGDAAVA